MISALEENPKNRDNYDDLLVSIEANQNYFNLLIAVCDNQELREQIIQQYEQELSSNLPCYRLIFSAENPSLLSLINQLIQENPQLKTCNNAVITVTGTEKFRFLFKEDNQEKSPQDQLLGFFQWTREAFKDFPYSIIIWMNSYLQQQLEQKSPDFWSWRKGVFRFVCPTTNIINISNFKDNLLSLSTELKVESSSLLPLEDLQELIATIEQKNQKQKNPQLAHLYGNLGQVYKERIERGQAINYREELNLAINYLQKAINLQEEFKLESELANSLNNLAILYAGQGKNDQAEPLFIKALELEKKLLGENHPEVANSLNNLAILYNNQGKDDQAELLYIQALELSKKLLEENHPNVANLLNNLAILYADQGKDDQAELLFIQALELSRKLLGENYPDVASTLNNLAILYAGQGKDDQAEPLFIKVLELRRKLLGENHPEVANSLNNLAILYALQGKDDQAELLYIQALELSKKLLGENHPNVAKLLNNLAVLYKNQGKNDQAESLFIKALELRKKLLGENHPDVVQSLNNLAILYASQGKYDQAEPLYIQALELRKKLLGEDHPQTISVNSNFLYFLQKVIEENKVNLLSDHPLTQSMLQVLLDDSIDL